MSNKDFINGRYACGATSASHRNCVTFSVPLPIRGASGSWQADSSSIEGWVWQVTETMRGYIDKTCTYMHKEGRTTTHAMEWSWSGEVANFVSKPLGCLAALALYVSRLMNIN